MLASIISAPINLLSLGARAHAILIAGADEACRRALERDRDTCRICGVSAPGCMEIDHVKGHAPCGPEGMAAICTFCHDLKHPLWSAARGRITPIFAPDLTQADVTRLAWIALSRRGDPAFDISGIFAGIKARARRMEEIVGCATAESLFEAAFTSSGMMGAEKGREVMLKVDQVLRFWPTETLSASPDEALPPAARMSTWRLGGFKVFADEAARAFRGSDSVDVDRLMKAATAINGKG
jgi:hypothetical protein